MILIVTNHPPHTIFLDRPGANRVYFNSHPEYKAYNMKVRANVNACMGVSYIVVRERGFNLRDRGQTGDTLHMQRWQREVQSQLSLKSMKTKQS